MTNVIRFPFSTQTFDAAQHEQATPPEVLPRPQKKVGQKPKTSKVAKPRRSKENTRSRSVEPNITEISTGNDQKRYRMQLRKRVGGRNVNLT